MQCYPVDGRREYWRFLGAALSSCVLVTALLSHQKATAQVSDFSVLPNGRPASFNKLEISVDSAASLRQGAMAVVLDTGEAGHGGISPDATPEMFVTLLQPTGLKTTVRARPGQVFAIPGVTEGYVSLIVTSGMEANSLASPYAAMGFVAKLSQNAVPSSAAVRVPVAMLDVRRLAEDLREYQTLDVGEDEVLGRGHFATVGRSQFQLQRSPDGSLVGRVLSPQRGFVEFPGPTKVMLYRDRVIVAQTTSVADGTFRIERAPLGDISLVAVGPAGHAAYRIHIVDSGIRQALKPVAGKHPDEFPRLVSVDRRGRMVGANRQTNEMQVLLVPTSLNDEVQQLIQQADQQEAPEDGGLPGADPLGPTGGGFTGGGGGVGGGSGGGGGLGSLGDLAGLAGAVGIAAGAAALADDDDGFNVNQATQITP